jgi:sialidase-1
MSTGKWIVVAGVLLVTALMAVSTHADDKQEPLIQPQGAKSHSDVPTGLPLDEARTCIVGHDHNRPDDFPGLGDFIGWPGDLVRLANGQLMFVHSAGYWHVSFATPFVLSEGLQQSYAKWFLDRNHQAPTGGRIMSVRSSDNGRTWTKPVTLFNNEIDNGPSVTFVTNKGTVIQIVNQQASWYGVSEVPPGHQLRNTLQLVIRSTDNGQTWSEPVPLNGAGTHYTRGRSRCLQIHDGGILWMSYNKDDGVEHLYGTIHRSDDDGLTWQIVSKISREGKDTDEGDLGRLSSGRLVLVLRRDGGTLVSDDDGVEWKQVGQVGPDYVFAPHLVVLPDDTIVLTAGGSQGQCMFLSTDGGANWTPPIRIDPGVYGYGKLFLMDDETILMSYVMSGSTPNRCYLVRLRVNEQRDGIELLPIGT